MDTRMDNDYQLGEVVARQALHAASVAEIKAEVTALRVDVHEIRLTLARVEGAWRFAVIAAGVIGAILGILGRWFITQLMSK